MENESGKNRRKKLQRQEWNPHWSLKLLYSIWMAVFSAFKIAIGAAVTVLMIVLVCAVVFVGILGDYLQNDILPAAAEYESTVTDLEQTSFIYHVNSRGEIEVAQRLYTDIDRQWVDFEDIPEDLVHAAVAIEDKRFYEHQGVDWITTVKACIGMFMGGDGRGGSTITQQLIKNDTEENSVTVQRKVSEIFRALYLEKKVDKNTIMEWYLNTIYFGSGAYGVKAAAEEYFGKELKSLTVAECASLISITNNPSLYNPYRDNLDKNGKTGAEQNQTRQLNTLNEMYEQGWITQDQYNEAKAQAYAMEFKSGIAQADKWAECVSESCDYEGTVSTYTAQGGSYFCPVCGTQAKVTGDSSEEVYSYFIDTVLEDVAADLAAQAGVVWDDLDTESKKLWKQKVCRGGYHIYSTLDMDVQEKAEAIYEDLNQIPSTRSNQQLQSAIVIINNETGDIVAMVGGVGTDKAHDGQNRATDSKLQTGSAQKPISVYAPAFESGKVNPGTIIYDLPTVYSGNSAWPKNDNHRYSFSRTIYNGIVNSVNTIAVRTLEKNSYEYSFSFAKDKFGLSTLTESYIKADGEVLSDLGSAPLALGALTEGATVRDMAAAYATFPNHGVYREARTYTKVYDSNGKIVLDNTQDSRQILSYRTANYMNYCLFMAANYGTGGAAIFDGQNIAGKTGTTSSNKDRWFCGYTGHYTAAVWTGYDNPEQIRLTGSSANPAAVLWRKVMQPVHRGLNRVASFNGDGMYQYEICMDSGLRATDACHNDVRGLDRISTVRLYPEDAPDGYCTKHIEYDFCITGGGVATEYCRHFEDVKVGYYGLLKLTQDEVDSIRMASDEGLYDVYSEDYYVYYVTDGGTPLAWYGFDGNANWGKKSAYVTCPVHTKAAYDEYLASQQPDPTDPANPENNGNNGNNGNGADNGNNGNNGNG